MVCVHAVSCQHNLQLWFSGSLESQGIEEVSEKSGNLMVVKEIMACIVGVLQLCILNE